MPKFGLSRAIGMGPFNDPSRYKSRFGPIKRDLTKLSFGYLKRVQRKHGIYRMHNAARRIQKIYRGSAARRKYPVKLFASMRRSGRFAAPSFRMSTLYK